MPVPRPPARACAGRPAPAPDRGPSARRGLLLADLALEEPDALRQLALARLRQERVEPAAVLDRAQGVRRDAQPDRTAEHVGLQGHVAEVRPELPLRLAVRVAHEVAREHGLAGEFAAARHGSESWS